MKKLLLLLPILFLASCQVEQTCVCEKQYYDKYNEHQFFFSLIVDNKYCDGSEVFQEDSKNNQIFKYVLKCE